MLSHLQSEDRNKMKNHIPIDHIKELKITDYFLKRSTIVICLMERLYSISVKGAPFKVILLFLLISISYQVFQ